MAVNYELAALKTLCLEWQKELGLSDWNISVKVSMCYEMNKNTEDADVHYVPSRKEAAIRIVDINHRSPESIDEPDQEVSLVHELLHLKLWHFSSNDSFAENTLVEQTINDIAASLVRLKRASRQEGS